MMIFKSKVSRLRKEVRGAFGDVGKDVDMIIENHNSLAEEFAELRDELATNGVIRDIRQLQKENKTLRDALEGLRGFVQSKFDQLERNGVATAVNKLNDEVFKKEKEGESIFRYTFLDSVWGDGGFTEVRPTLAGKVDAILEHLKLDVEIKPEEVTKAKPVAKKKPAPKKKGRK